MRSNNTVYIIEHLESELYPWCIIEYKHISKIVKGNVWFTNIKKKDVGKLNKYGKVFTSSVRDMKLTGACVLDPAAPKTLTPGDASEFDYFIFGGILGDNPPRARTRPELTRFLPAFDARNIGKEQFSTDNAVFVVSQISKGKDLGKMKFQEGVEIRINEIESTILPYKYPIVNGKPNISKELVKYIIKKDSQ